MSEELILQGSVMWSYDYEVMEYTPGQKLISGLSGFGGPLHNHKGNIGLTDESIIIEGDDDDDDLVISLSSINQIYLGYDEFYTADSVKNAGLFWKPLRLAYYSSSNQQQTIYLIIDYMGLYSHDKRWYETLVSMLE
jgi:hypothetical protein